MGWQEILSFVSGTLFLVAYLPYVADLLRRKIEPQASTWMTWSVLDALVLSGMVARGTDNCQIWAASIGTTFVALLVLFIRGLKGWNRIDTASLLLAGLAATLWLVFQESLFGIVLGSVAIVVGSFSTIISVWHNPEKEDSISWLIFWLSCLLMMPAIKDWSLGGVIQPLSFLLLESVILWPLRRLTFRRLRFVFSFHY